MSVTMTVRFPLTAPALISFCAYLALAGGASAQTTAAITAALLPDRLGARAALRLRASFLDQSATVPTAVRHVSLLFPTGMTLDVPRLRSCTRTRLLALGMSGCPARSALGHGHALAEALLGSQSTRENVTLWLFLGPPHNLQPTVEILGQGFTPLDEQVVLDGRVLSEDRGERLELSIPPMPTLPLEPDASIATISMTVGAHGRSQNAVRVPRRCPAGGFRLAGDFLYADGSRASATTTIPCPR